jgi:hypothetical protein
VIKLHIPGLGLLYEIAALVDGFWVDGAIAWEVAVRDLADDGLHRHPRDVVGDVATHSGEERRAAVVRLPHQLGIRWAYNTIPKSSQRAAKDGIRWAYSIPKSSQRGTLAAFLSIVASLRVALSMAHSVGTTRRWSIKRVPFHFVSCWRGDIFLGLVSGTQR